MIDRDIRKHAGEFLAYLKNHQYEVTDKGILFPKAHVVVFGEYEDHMGVTRNLIPTEGVTYILGNDLADPLYLAIYSGDYTPAADLTAANFTATATEIVSGTEGYTETMRRPWDSTTTSPGVRDNYAAKAEFTIATATTLTIRGAALLSSQVKGSTTGSIVSATKFSAPRVEYNGNTYSLGYRVRGEAA